MFTTDDKSPSEVAEIAAQFARISGHGPIRRIDGPCMVLVECESCHDVGVVTAQQRPGCDGALWSVQDAQIFRVHPEDRCDAGRRNEPPF